MAGALERAAGPTVVGVTGMHRCGTSLVAGALRFLGVSLGDPERLMPPGPDNPVGYFEIESVMEFNERLLAHLGGAWDQPPVLDPGWEGETGLDSFRREASDILGEAFGTAAGGEQPIGFKDPRLSLLLPFWRTVIPITTTIVLVRDPLEVAASLAARKYRVEAPQAASLWLRYLFAATANDPGHLLVRYGALFEDLDGTLDAIVRHLGVAAPDPRAVHAARDHLVPTLRHHLADQTPAAAHNPLMRIAIAVWNGGAVDFDCVPEVVRDAIARGWFRPPLDGELLARARADVVALKDSVRRLNEALARRR
jgi:hypothetical protein